MTAKAQRAPADAAAAFAQYAGTAVAHLGAELYEELYEAIATAQRDPQHRAQLAAHLAGLGRTARYAGVPPVEGVICACVDLCTEFSAQREFATHATALAKVDKACTKFRQTLDPITSLGKLREIDAHLAAIRALLRPPEKRRAVESAVAELLHAGGVRPRRAVAKHTAKIVARMTTMADYLQQRLNKVVREQHVVDVLRAALRVPTFAISTEHRQERMAAELRALGMHYTQPKDSKPAPKEVKALPALQRRLYTDAAALSAAERATLKEELDAEAAALQGAADSITSRLADQEQPSARTIEVRLSTERRARKNTP